MTHYIRTLREQALLHAQNAHYGQVDKRGRAYINHLEEVAAGFSDDTLYVAALMHDIVEDGHCTVEEIRAAYGTEVADIVDLLTRRESEHYVTYILRICESGNLNAMYVKISDLACNMDPMDATEEEQYALQSLQRRYLIGYKMLTQCVDDILNEK